MIRYPCDLPTFEKSIDSYDARWKKKAADRAKKIIAKGRFDEKSSIWTTVKPAYMAMQRNKCVFCERLLESERYGKIEFDLEHFRPKSSVQTWPVASRHGYTYDFETGAAGTGYYWLAYDLTNYAASCKVCNTNLKSDFFPIAGNRCNAPGSLDEERPFLCYPIGDGDDDPEELVTFVATTAVPAAADGHRRRRGQVIIDFFDLNKREHLHRQRAHMIMLLGGSLDNISAGRASVADRLVVAKASQQEMPHASCLRAFRRAWDQDVAFGRRVLEACKNFFASEEGTAAPAPAP
jgi:hypothetical protein